MFQIEDTLPIKVLGDAETFFRRRMNLSRPPVFFFVMDTNDETLFANFQRDPEKGFAAIYDRFAGPLLRYIYRFTGDQASAEDLLHDVFAQLLRGNFSEGPDASLKSWLFTCAKNASLNFERKRKREVLDNDRIDAAVDPAGADDAAHEKDWQRTLGVIEARLPKDLGETWRLRRSGLDYAAIAAQLKIPVGTVKSRFHRLVAFFQKEMNIHEE